MKRYGGVWLGLRKAGDWRTRAASGDACGIAGVRAGAEPRRVCVRVEPRLRGFVAWLWLAGLGSVRCCVWLAGCASGGAVSAL